MIKSKLFLISILTTCLTFCLVSKSFAQDTKSYPNISGKTLFEFRGDRLTSTNKENVDDNNANINIDADFDLSFTKNWSLITGLRFKPVNDQSYQNPERYREILSENRGIGLGDDGLIIEQLKGQFENEDAKFFFGKFNAPFGTAFRKEKRIGVFTIDFTKDYELREKLGAGFSVLLENSELTIDAFMNDQTALGQSAIKSRGSLRKADGLAGNTSSPSSYSVAFEGQDLFGVKDLFYNLGYRDLAVDNTDGSDNEKGYVGGLEYLFPLSSKASLIPFAEIAKFDNFSGEKDRDALYTTIALIGKYSSWTASVSNVNRTIENQTGKNKDRQMVYSIGYKFTNNIAIDVSKAKIKEDGYNSSLIGVLASYIYNF